MLQFITHTNTKHNDIVEGARLALEGGCRWIQLRMKGASPDMIVDKGIALRKLCDLYGAKLIIDDHVELVDTIGADGVHLGKNDMPVGEARKLLGNDKIIGATANTFDDIAKAVAAGADYIGLGPFRFTQTKEKLSPTLGIEGYRNIMTQCSAAGINIPVVAIGGITVDDMPQLATTGIAGVAISGAILNAPDPIFETNKFIKIMDDKLIIGGKEFASRLFVGTGKFSSNEIMREAIIASGTNMVTVAMKRIDMENPEDDMLRHIAGRDIQLLPNTSGVRDAREAVLAAQLAREAFETDFIKLEIHPDPKYLLPDPVETLKATEELARLGFKVLPYIQADPVLCKRLEEVGTAAVMPLAAPIGTNKGLVTRDLLEIIIAESNVPVVIDAGLGAPSHAASAMEMGADAVLVNTAIAIAGDPVAMAHAFAIATAAGREAYKAGLACTSVSAVASSPLTSFLDL